MNKYPMKIGNLFKLSFKEEIGNSVSHGVMALFFLISLPFVSVLGYLKSGISLSAGYSIYTLCLFLMFLMSMLYHTMVFESSQKKVFRILDHCSIYLAIAGSFTPISLYVLDGWFLWFILVLQWGIVLFGIIYKSLTTNKKTKSGVILYLIMGWSSVVIIPKLIASQSVAFLLMIVLGGLFYSIGVYFYANKTKAWFHFIWHLFVNIAAMCHFIAIILLLK